MPYQMRRGGWVGGWVDGWVNSSSSFRSSYRVGTLKQNELIRACLISYISYRTEHSYWLLDIISCSMHAHVCMMR